MNAAPRCGAKTRRGTPCQQAGMKNGRCRMHGGKAGAPPGERNGRYTHGRRTKEAKAARKEVRELMKSMVRLMALIEGA